MTNIFYFKSNSKLSAEQNLADFIDRCRNELTVFGSDLDWDNTKWHGYVQWTKFGVHSRQKLKPENYLNDEFVNFSKAYFRYRQGHKPSKYYIELLALRCLEAALLKVHNSGSLLNTSIAVLDFAAELGREHYNLNSAYKTGLELERLADFISENRLSYNNVFGWRSPMTRPRSGVRTGKKAESERSKKMPDPTALDALAEIFSRQPESPRDIMTSAVWAMLMCAPSRIHEVVTLPANLEITEVDKSGVERYGWRFYSGKGYGGDIKWIPTPMVDIAKEAVQRIRVLTQPARDLAAWVEKHPDRFYRHNACPDVDEHQPLTIVDACKALGLAHGNGNQCRTSLRDWRLPTVDGANTLASLWAEVMRRQPKDFPWLDKERGIKYKDGLFCMQKHLVHAFRGTSAVLVTQYGKNTVTRDMGPVTGTNLQSIFDRNGYVGKDGQRLKVNSHQARHFLNTIAQKGGLSQLEIAKWSGRADVRQNRVYNHMSEFEMVAKAESLDITKSFFGPSGEVIRAVPKTVQEFNTLQRGFAHITEFGFCVHDYTMTPCEKYRDCLNCCEQVCIKGQDEKLKRLKEKLQLMEAEWEAACADVEEGVYGADRWSEYHLKTITRTRQLIHILENPDVPEGAVIKLVDHQDFSHLGRAINNNPEVVLENDKHSDLAEGMGLILGGGLG
ncbi:hypothetical protein [Endozoicomonas sp. SESOKO1]|uniref:hypothetical protein n=1 Tax=Endozoicomonas sp. SESOKO1 TaxID=2828742 RepID=UPI002148DD8A|nr:hypothetical protein [Endozoicomonas sp. SESOKO1]